MSTKAVGTKFECKALNYLTNKKLELITQNYYCKHGEIDLIFSDKVNQLDRNIIFVEVRYRKSIKYGHPVQTISKAKQKKLLLSAYSFLNDFPQYSQLQYRFDAVTIHNTNSLKSGHTHLSIQWFKNIITGENTDTWIQ